MVCLHTPQIPCLHTVVGTSGIEKNEISIFQGRETRQIGLGLLLDFPTHEGMEPSPGFCCLHSPNIPPDKFSVRVTQIGVRPSPESVTVSQSHTFHVGLRALSPNLILLSQNPTRAEHKGRSCNAQLHRWNTYC